MLGTPNAMEMRSDFVGKVFSFLTVKDVVPFGTRAQRLQCVCVCGTVVLAKTHQLTSREKTSCGCWKKQVLGYTTRTHGQANSRVSGYKSRAYGVWQAMRDRCSNPNRKDYHRYGGRGITVCKQWGTFEAFLADMGEPPVGLTLERKDNNKGYSKQNCEWATRRHQSYNSSRNVYIEHKGKTMMLKQWQQTMGVQAGTYYARLKRGWSIKEALSLVPR